MLKLFQRLTTKNLKEIPLLWITFNYQKFKENGKKNSCLLNIHPLLKDDDYIKETLNKLIDYIRDKYNMDEM